MSHGREFLIPESSVSKVRTLLEGKHRNGASPIVPHGYLDLAAHWEDVVQFLLDCNMCRKSEERRAYEFEIVCVDLAWIGHGERLPRNGSKAHRKCLFVSRVNQNHFLPLRQLDDSHSRQLVPTPPASATKSDVTAPWDDKEPSLLGASSFLCPPDNSSAAKMSPTSISYSTSHITGRVPECEATSAKVRTYDKASDSRPHAAQTIIFESSSHVPPVPVMLPGVKRPRRGSNLNLRSAFSGCAVSSSCSAQSACVGMACQGLPHKLEDSDTSGDENSAEEDSSDEDVFFSGRRRLAQRRRRVCGARCCLEALHRITQALARSPMPSLEREQKASCQE